MFVPVCACEEELLGPRKVWSAFVGPGVRICDWDRVVEKNFSDPGKFFRLSWEQVRMRDWDRVVEKNFSNPGKFFRLSWDQGFECVTGTGWWKKTFRTPESFFGFRGTRGSNMSLGQGSGKNFSDPGKFFRLSWDQGFEYVTGTGWWKKTFRTPESFFGFRGTRGSNA